MRIVARLDETEVLERVGVTTVARPDASEALGRLAVAVILQVILAPCRLQLQIVNQYALAARRLFELAQVEHGPVQIQQLDGAVLPVDRARQCEDYPPRDAAKLSECIL